MGRLGITYEQVAEGAEMLLAKSETPTIEKVRRALGDTGSNSIISRHLREWKSKRLGGQQPQAALLPDPLSRLVTQLWEQLRAESQVVTECLQQEAEAKINQAEHDKEAMEKVCQSVKEQLAKISLQNNHYQTDLKLLQNELAEERRQRLKWETHAAQADRNLQRLQQEAKQHATDLERFHQETLQHIKQQYEVNEKRYQETIDEFKALIETNRQKYILEIDQLKVAKSKVRIDLAKLENEFNHHVKRCQDLEEKAIKAEFDRQVIEHQQQEKDRELLEIKADTKSKDAIIQNLNQEINYWQQKFERVTEQVVELKAAIMLKNSKKSIKVNNPK